MAEEINKPETKFNMSLAILERINNILNDIAIFSAHQEVDRWFDCLRTLSREFSYLMKKDESEDNKTYVNKIMIYYCEYKFSRDKQSISNHFSKFTELLEEYDGWLKKLLYEKGLLIIHKEDIHKAVMRR